MRLPTFSATLLLALAVLPAAGAGESAAGYRVIVHPDSTVGSLTRQQVSKLFLRKTTRWEDGVPVRPVDLVETAEVRERFSRHVHGRRAWAIKAYWQQMIFSGRATPPPEVPTEEQVLAYVRATPGAIGYVSTTAALGDVKPLPVEE